MQDAKTFDISLDHLAKLPVKQYPQTMEVTKIMENTSYASEVGSIMYNIVFSMIDLEYSISIVNQFVKNPGQVHRIFLK